MTDQTQESGEGDSWEEEGGELFNLITHAHGAINPEEFKETRAALMEWIRTKKVEWETKRGLLGHEQGMKDEAEIRDRNDVRIRTLALQEVAVVLREMIADIHRKQIGSLEVQAGQINKLEDAAREIESKIL